MEDIFESEDLSALADSDTADIDVSDTLIVPENVNTETIQSDEDKKELSAEDSPYTLSMRRREFNDEKDMNKFVKAVERLVRGCPEYRDWTGYIKETLGHYTCSLTGELSSQVDVDIHHHPISLYTITKAVIFKYINSSKEFCAFDISQDVMNMHFDNKIGYVLIVRTLHQKFHNGFLHLPMDIVHGNWQHCVYEYEHDDDDLEILNGRLAITRENCGWGQKYKWSSGKYNESKDE